MTPPLLEMRQIEKSFFGVKVLKDVPLELHRGEVLALLGENGAGKSTLIKILNGDYGMDRGTILLNGQVVSFAEPRDAEAAGIRMIYQELHYAPDLTVAENMGIGHLSRGRGPLGRHIVDWRRVYQEARSNLELFGVDIDPRARMRDLTVVERQIVEIVKAVSAEAHILVMDEPTAALTPHEVERLFDLVRDLKEREVGIIYVSHRLDEIFEIADRVHVLRDGQHVATRPINEVSPKLLVELMVGREIKERKNVSLSRGGRAAPQPVLEVRNLSRRGAYQGINLKVHYGEIVGIFGLLGSGQIPLTRAIYGAEVADHGTILVDGNTISIRSPLDSKRAGIGFVPVDRKVSSLILGLSVTTNITLSNWRNLSALGFFRASVERAHAQQWIERLGIRMAGSMETPVRLLSGGNQQKVVLARWLEANVKVLILNEPTLGVDVGARSDIYDQLEHLAAQGLAVLMVSSDIQEVLSISHRVLTLYRGRLTGEFDADQLSHEAVLNAAAGGAT